MSDPSTYWLTVMNVVLGLVVLICCIAVAAGIVQEFAARRRKRAAVSALETELPALDGHLFNVPGLGVTMADGGEPSREKEKR